METSGQRNEENVRAVCHHKTENPVQSVLPSLFQTTEVSSKMSVLIVFSIVYGKFVLKIKTHGHIGSLIRLHNFCSFNPFRHYYQIESSPMPVCRTLNKKGKLTSPVPHINKAPTPNRHASIYFKKKCNFTKTLALIPEFLFKALIGRVHQLTEPGLPG